jgi:putative hydrolase of the HAD superfamily
MQAVTFDFWQTLVAETPGVMRGMQVERFAATLSRAGHEVSEDRIAALFQENWKRFEAAWRTNAGPYGARETVDFICDRLGIEEANGLKEELLDGFRQVGETVDLRVADGLPECLGRLRGSGVRLGIVCDVGLTASTTLRTRLDGFGLLGYFDAWAFSDETGWFKPAPGAFLPALGALGVTDPSRAAHVGDNRRTDVAGALALGMTAVRYTGLGGAAGWDPSHEEGPEAPVVIEDMRSLPDALGV